MPDIAFLDLRGQLAAALQQALTPAEARFRVKLCLADVGKNLLLSGLLPPELESALEDPFAVDDVAEFEGIVSKLRKYFAHLPEIAVRLPVLSFWLATLGGPASQWHLGRCVVELVCQRDGNVQKSPSSDDREMAAGLEKAWAEHESEVMDVSGTTDQAEAVVVGTCYKAAGAYMVFTELEHVLDVLAQDASDFLAKCKQADRARRRWDDLLDSVCRLPARSPAGRYAKHRLVELLAKLEPSALPGSALERIIVSGREDFTRFGSG